MTEQQAQTARPNRLIAYDEQQAQLRADWPQWHIWYVPCVKPSSGELDITWCAQPLPLLNCHSVEALVEEMTDAQQAARRLALLAGDEPITSVQVHCADCNRTTRAQGGLTAQLVLGIVEAHKAKGHVVEVLIPAPTSSLADRHERPGPGTITGRW